MNESTLNGALRVTIERAPLAAALALLVRGVTRRNTIPILSNVAISADNTGNGMLRFLVTNLDQQILIDVPAYVDAPGALTCDAAALADIVKKCPAGARVELMHHVDSGKVSIVAGRARSAIGVMPRDDFPAVADVAPAWAFQYDRDALALDLARLAPCISSEETRYYLNGVAWRARRGGLALVASDGVQAAVIDRAGFPDAAGLGDAGTISGGAILPRAAVDLLQRAVKLADSGAVACAFDSARAQFTVAAGGSFVTVTSKLIDGDYPDVMGAVDSAIGDGLARVMFPEIDDRINAGMLAKLAKPCAGAVAVDMGASGAILTCEAAPEYLGVMMAVRDGANKIGKFEYRGDDWRAVQYLRSLAVAGGIDVEALDSVDENDKPVLCEARLIQGAGTVTGATFGKVEYIPESYVEALNYDTLTVERVKVEARHEYQAGAFSIAMPAAAGVTIAGLGLCCLTPTMRENTCSYWFTLTTRGMTPHTAFRTRAALLKYLERRGLALSAPLPDDLGTHAWIPIVGEYVEIQHFNRASFDAVAGERFAALNNGAYRPAISESLPDGRRAIHRMNCNVEQESFDYRLASAAEDMGQGESI